MNQNDGVAKSLGAIDSASAPSMQSNALVSGLQSNAPPPLYRWLAFSDPRLEKEYLDQELESHRKSIIANIAIAGTLIAAFAALDSMLLPEAVLKNFAFARFAVQIPLLALAIGITARSPGARPQILFTAIMMSVCQLCWPLLLAIGDGATLGYLSLALMQTMIGTYFMVGLPVRWSIPIVGAVCGLFLAVSVVAALPLAPIIMYGAGCITIALIGGFGAYRAEDASRRRFLAMRRSAGEYHDRLAAEAELNRWLTKFADFLRHELRNPLAGIRTSLELARRSTTLQDVAEYIERGERSLAFMQKVLSQVASATSLESALAAQAVERVDLSTLLHELLADFASDHDAWRVEERIAHNIHVAANAESLVQMMVKLLDNAIAHGDRAWPLQVTVQSKESHAVIDIANRGEALPMPVASVFEPFVSTKRERSQSPHLGLGLFVAKTIATSLRGDIQAAPLIDPPGAVFTIRLPLLTADPHHDSTQR